MIRIHNACLEDWNQMKPVEGGRMCDRCALKVTDYSRNQIGEGTSGGCGRFRLDQIHSAGRTFQATRWAGWSMTLLSFLGLIDGNPLSAQTEVVPLEGAIPERSAAGQLRIHGHVVTAEGGQAIEARFEVYRLGTLVKALKTDLNGRFDLQLDTSAHDLRELEVRFIASEGMETVVGPDGLRLALQGGEMVVTLELAHQSMGEQNEQSSDCYHGDWIIAGAMSNTQVSEIHGIDSFTSGSRFTGEEIERFGRR